MKVLDVGSGAGDVALLAADFVGPSGRVVGVDGNAEILGTARGYEAIKHRAVQMLPLMFGAWTRKV